ncbi:MAG: DoxX family protein [Planctomycetales bacterium]|nr:DoxX family protein [Planctomycetales bacterium]
MTWTGWGLAAPIALLLTFSGVMKLLSPPEMVEQVENHLGYPAAVLVPLGIVELTCLALYLVPPTSVLGAILLTGYLGGATATHVRIEESFIPPVIFGVLVWLGLYLRDPRVRALVPWRSSPASPNADASQENRG